MLEHGVVAPDFELPDQQGEPVALSNFRGQWVVLYFYPRADTPGCTTQACEFRDDWSAFQSHDIPVFGISDDPVDDLDAFAEKYDLPFRLLSDESGDVADEYDSYGEKTVFGNRVMGVFRNTYVIDPDGTIAAVFEDVSPEGHAAEVLDSIPITDEPAQ